ncbi:precorrin 6A synthase [Aeromicrobium sp. Root495]|uniref:precorrin-6A synthase (deacetylating) n=1 Tax=Aeromicrobium sp. Root495 TaxID=1736550 RepID=UPI0006F3F82E|nr:precorrin-6A synthase (deacetylating) [Aeromicrobium sp. Root495]KQY60476.1 precorrin 6A synthase [Aeromicrobium sp. Root495]
MTRRVRLVGIGCGHPDQLTIEAVEALKASSCALVTVKREDDPLAAARHAIIERHAPGLRVVEVADPERDRSARSTATVAGYEDVVTDWHDARAEAWEAALSAAWADAGDGSGDVALLVWGDPAFYDSTIRVVERVLARGALDFEWDVLPGISALQLLAARHRIVLHEVGQPILVTTARRLRAAVVDGAENVVVMLSAGLELEGLDDWQIWWGANLGTSDERLVAGRVADVLPTLLAARDEAKSVSGWVMDVYLLRRPRAVT